MMKKNREKEKMHAQRRYATCSQGMSKKREREIEKRCIPKEDMPHAPKVCQKKERKNIAIPKKNNTREREII